MTINDFLAEQGLTAEEIAVVVGNPSQSKAMSAALQRYEDGLLAKTQADAEKAETAKFWEGKTQELQNGVSRLTAAEKRAAQAEASAAQRTAYLKSLKDQGYDVPDEMIGAPSHALEPPKYVTQEDFQKGVRATAPDLVSLTALSNEYYDLFGSPYVAVEDDFRAAQSAGKSLREFARSKYNFDGKRTEKADKADKERIAKIVKEEVEVERAKLVEQYGGNPETRVAMPSKFDKLTNQPGFKSDSWKSVEGRKANREARLKKFDNVSLQ